MPLPNESVEEDGWTTEGIAPFEIPPPAACEGRERTMGGERASALATGVVDSSPRGAGRDDYLFPAGVAFVPPRI